ncbi:restriction endonuclease [Nocardia sp. NPDC052566]|uniref:restriction endonuclease n=1 Tax=Nocardia sp. NPDC052566 TaxID=3364330 RepID=UPI0037C7E38F
MARRGFLAEVQYQMRLREREQQRFVMQQQRLMAQAEREQARAVKAADRASAQAAKEERERHIARQLAYAAHLSAMDRDRAEELALLLVEHAAEGRTFAVEQLFEDFQPRPFVPPANLAAAAPAPVWEQYEPPAPTGLGRVFTAGYKRELAARRTYFDQACAQHEEYERRRSAALAAAEQQHNAEERSSQREIAEHNAQVAALERGVAAGEPAAVEECFALFLEGSRLPAELPIEVEVAYQPNPRRLLIDRRLPGIDVIPPNRDHRYVRNRDEITAITRPVKEIRQRYADLLAQLVLVTLRDAFAVQPSGLVDQVGVNALLAGRNKATGQPEDLCLISVTATREQFDELVLAELDAVTCLQRMQALVSPHPWDMEPVRPIFDPDLSRYKLIDSLDVAGTLDARPILLDMSPNEFERLVRELFEAMGMNSWQTQPSKDDGVDAVAVNTDPIMGGVCVIQAKRYRKVVEIEAVRALAGVMEDMHASRGVLVTTSWFGKASQDFILRHGRMQLIDGPELKYLIKKHLGKDVIPGTVKPSRRKGTPDL